MKKSLSKLSSLGRKKKQPETPAGRITTDTLAEHREQVLAGGRKFKYPVQYARHKLVFNAIIIGVVAIVLTIVLGWYMLYKVQNTSNFMYRVTRVVPVPVARVDGQAVRYSDYLMKYRSSVHFLTEKARVDTASEDGKRQLEFIKSQAMRDALLDAYATKLAHEQAITVTDADLEAYIKKQRQSKDGEVSESTYNAVILDYYGWSPDEYRQAMKNNLLRQRVAYAIDDTSRELAKELHPQLSASGADFQAIAGAVSKEKGPGSVYAVPPTVVPLNNRDYGVSEAAKKLNKGEVSPVIQLENGGGLAIVRLLDKNDKELRYEYFVIPLTTLQQRFADLKGAKKLSLYLPISLDAQKDEAHQLPAEGDTTGAAPNN